MTWSPPHDECTNCRHYRRSRAQVRCQLCGAGEFFEEKVDDYRPSDDDLMRIYQDMTEEEGHLPAQADIEAVTDREEEEKDERE